MRWPSQKILRIVGLTLIGAAPFVVAFLLLPDGEEVDAGPSISPIGTGPTTTLEFPFFSPSPFPTASEPTAPTPQPSGIPRQCGDGRDNDRDGRVDMADPGCSSRSDNSEAPDPTPGGTTVATTTPTTNPPPPPDENCNDGQDNDGDGFTDGGDPGCNDGDEAPFNINPGGGDPCEVPGVPGCPAATTRPATTRPATTVPTTQTEPAATTTAPEE